MNIRTKWLKFMYCYNILAAAGGGLAMVLFPGLLQSLLKTYIYFPVQDPFFFGVTGCVWAGIGLLSIAGLRNLLKFTPVLMLQIIYKSIWLVLIFLPEAIKGNAPVYAVFIAFIFITIVAGNVIAVPFGYVFERGSIE